MATFLLCLGFVLATGLFWWWLASRKVKSYRGSSAYNSRFNVSGSVGSRYGVGHTPRTSDSNHDTDLGPSLQEGLSGILDSALHSHGSSSHSHYGHQESSSFGESSCGSSSESSCSSGGGEGGCGGGGD